MRAQGGVARDCLEDCLIRHAEVFLCDDGAQPLMQQKGMIDFCIIQRQVVCPGITQHIRRWNNGRNIMQDTRQAAL